MDRESWKIIDVFPEPILLIMLTGKVIKGSKSAYTLFPKLSQLHREVLFLADLLGTEVPDLDKKLRAWIRSPSMVSGSLPIAQKDGSTVKMTLEAVGLHEIGKNSLILLRFQRNQAMIDKFSQLSEQVNQLNEEIAQQKVTQAQLRLKYRKLMSKNQRLESLAFYDGLTGLANRRMFDETLESYWLEASEQKWSLGLILIDIDHFKIYNDTYGHPQGDICLKEVAQAIAMQIREEKDLAARYGGEEFVVLLRKSEESAVVNVINRIFEAVRRLAIPHENSATTNIVTLSAGIHTMIPPKIENNDNHRDMFVKKADQALYYAKKQGRNRYVLSSYLSQLEALEVVEIFSL